MGDCPYEHTDGRSVDASKGAGCTVEVRRLATVLGSAREESGQKL